MVGHLPRIRGDRLHRLRPNTAMGRFGEGQMAKHYESRDRDCDRKAAEQRRRRWISYIQLAATAIAALAELVSAIRH